MRKKKVGALKNPTDISHEILLKPNETTKTENYIKTFQVYMIK